MDCMYIYVHVAWKQLFKIAMGKLYTPKGYRCKSTGSEKITCSIIVVVPFLIAYMHITVSNGYYDSEII